MDRTMHCCTGGGSESWRYMRKPTVLVTVAMLVLCAFASPAGAKKPPPPPPPPGGGTYDTHLTRAPYLTDLVGLHVIVNFATDQSGSAASVSYGPSSGGTCTLGSSETAVRSTVTVGTVSEYQWKASLTLPSAGSYCYRALLGTTDLLGGRASPAFTTQAATGSSPALLVRGLRRLGPRRRQRQQPRPAGPARHARHEWRPLCRHHRRQRLPVGQPDELRRPPAGRLRDGRNLGANFWPVPGASVPLFTSAGNHGLSGTAHADLTNWPQDLAVASSGGRYANDLYCCVNGTTSTNYASAWYAFNAGPARFYVLTSAWGDTNTGTASVYANDYAAHFAPGTPEYAWLLADLQSRPLEPQVRVLALSVLQR